MTEYLKKSDVMAAYKTHESLGIKFRTALACQKHYTFPAPSDAVDGKLRERYQLLIRKHESFLNLKLEAYKSISDTINASHRWTDEALIRHGLEIIELLDDVMSSLPPAPSVAPPESDTSKLLAELDEWIILGERAVLYSNFDSAVVRLAKLVREIARLLAERGVK